MYRSALVSYLACVGPLLPLLNLVRCVDGETPNLRGQKCAAKATCEDCLAEGSGCYGWQGLKCCQEEECMSASANLTLYTSCTVWRQDQVLPEVCEGVQKEDACACIAVGCVPQTSSTGSVVCLHSEQPAIGRIVECQALVPSNERRLPSNNGVVIATEPTPQIVEWTDMYNKGKKDPTIGLAVGASASIFGGILAGDQITPTDMLTMATNWIPAIVGLTHPGLGLALTFAFSLISGLFQPPEQDPLQEMYDRIMQEVDMKMNIAFMKRILDEQSVIIQHTLSKMSMIPVWQEQNLSSDILYSKYWYLKNELEKVIGQLIIGEESFSGFEQQRYRATALPLVITCFQTIFSLGSEIVQVQPTTKGSTTVEINQQISQAQQFLRDALDDAWIVRRHHIFALQWVDQVGDSQTSCNTAGRCTTYCSAKGLPNCTDGFLGENACQQMGCDVVPQRWVVRDNSQCTRGMRVCTEGHHSQLLSRAREAVMLQHDTVEAILNVMNEDYNFRDSICNEMEFSLDEAGFENATKSLAKRVMKCYIRRAGAALRPELGSLDNWLPANLTQLSQKYLGSDLALSDLLSDIHQVGSSSGHAPEHPLPEIQECPKSRSTFDRNQRIMERQGYTEDQCVQLCLGTRGCRCVEHYASRACVLVKEGARRSEVPWYWFDKPKVIRLDQCVENFNTC